jgi:hypothetical protein
MNEKQLYYKEKYFKYKLKYLTLKEELEGGGWFSSKKADDTEAIESFEANLEKVDTPLSSPRELTSMKKINDITREIARDDDIQSELSKVADIVIKLKEKQSKLGYLTKTENQALIVLSNLLKNSKRAHPDEEDQ